MSEEIKDEVKKKYSSIVLDNEAGCGCGCSNDELSTFALDYSNLKGYNKDADYALGCGIPTGFADIKKGDTVLDLGSGAGNDAFVTRNIVGESGHVIGVDMTEAMIEKANLNKTKLKHENIEFRLGEIENLPVDNDSVDVVISNCVINLVPDKRKAYQEIYRVLKNSGSFTISDVVINGSLPEKAQKSIELYVGCIGGAIAKEEYIGIASEAGFSDVSIVEEKEYKIPDDLLIKHLGKTGMEELKKNGAKVLSVTIKGVK